MDKLEFEDILKGLSDGNLEPGYIIELLEAQELNYLYDDQLEQIALSFDRDDDKIAMLKYVFSPINIISTLETEESVVKAIGELNDDEQIARVALEFLKKDENRLSAIKRIKDKDKSLPVKILLSREDFKKLFFKGIKKYDKIGLDKEITIGLEIESIGENSQIILESGKRNGIIKHETKGIDCGQIIKRR